MKIWKILPFLVLLLFTACRSSKEATEGTSADKDGKEAVYLRQVIANSQRADCVTAKVNVDLNALDKHLSVNGRLRMKRDEVVQLSLNLLGFEVGRMEFTPQHVLVVDRVNKQFVRANYADVGFLQQADLDFYTLQALFWNELFVPGQQSVSGQLSRFQYEDAGSHVLLSLSDTPKLSYTFRVQKEPSFINHVTVKGKRMTDSGSMEWHYDNFTRLDNRYFPTLMTFRLLGFDQEVGLTLALNRLDNNDKWSTTTTISSRYKERRVEDILRQLLAM